MDTEKKETKEINKLSLLVVAVVVLALIVGGSVYYILHQRKQIDEMTQSFDLEKEMMEDDLNEISLQYEGYKFNVSSDSLAALLTTEQAKVQRLMEELRTVKSTNAKEISRLKKEIATLRKIMRNYVVQIDSLNRANEQLKVEKNEAVKKYQQASTTAASLKKEKEKLTERVTLASKLDATDGTVCGQLPHREKCDGSGGRKGDLCAHHEAGRRYPREEPGRPVHVRGQRNQLFDEEND